MKLLMITVGAIVVFALLNSIQSVPLTDVENEINEFDTQQEEGDKISNIDLSASSDCFLKSELYPSTHHRRLRRASISRAFWNTQLGYDKRFTPFAPRLGKRTNDDDTEDDVPSQPQLITKSDYVKEFYAILTLWLTAYPEDISFQDKKEICVPKPIVNNLMQQIVDTYNYHGRQTRQGNKQSYFLYPYENALVYRPRTG